MTRVDIKELFCINGTRWVLNFHTYVYEYFYKNTYLKQEIERLKNAKFEYKGI